MFLRSLYVVCFPFKRVISHWNYNWYIFFPCCSLPIHFILFSQNKFQLETMVTFLVIWGCFSFFVFLNGISYRTTVKELGGHACHLAQVNKTTFEIMINVRISMWPLNLLSRNSNQFSNHVLLITSLQQ